MAQEQTGWTRQEIVQQLVRSPHGDLASYAAPIQQALRADAEFVAHLIAWQETHGTVDDAKLALPLYTLRTVGLDPLWYDNALAHLALRSVYDLTQKVWPVVRKAPTHGADQHFRRLARRYIEHAQQSRGRWQYLALQYRHYFKALYKIARIKPAKFAQHILFERTYSDGSPYAAVAHLPVLAPEEIAVAMERFKLPFLVVQNQGQRLGASEATLLPFLQAMTPAQVIHNTKLLRKLGVLTYPATRALYEQKCTEAAEGTSRKRAPVLKAARAADAVAQAGDMALSHKLRHVTERAIDAGYKFTGNILLLGDRSPSMQATIDYVRQLAAYLAKVATGQVRLTFFDAQPRAFDVTGLTYAQLQGLTRSVSIGGATSIGCGVEQARLDKFVADIIVIVSDGGENRAPFFAETYASYTKWLGEDVPVVFFHVDGSTPDVVSDAMMRSRIAFDRQHVDAADYYSIPMLAQMLRPRYQLVQQIYDTPLKTLEDVLPLRKETAHAGLATTLENV